MANQLFCLALVLVFQTCMVASRNEYYQYYHTYFHHHKKTTPEAVPSSEDAFSSPVTVPDSEPGISSSLNEVSPSTERVTETDVRKKSENEIPVEDAYLKFATQRSYSQEDFYNYKLKWLLIARVVAIVGGILLFIILVCCIGCFCNGGFRKERPGRILGSNAPDVVPPPQQTAFLQHAPPAPQNMQPYSLPPYYGEKCHAPSAQDTAYLTKQMEEQLQYSPNQNSQNPATAPPPYQERY